MVHLGWHDGKRRRKYYYGRTRAEVRDKYRKAQRALEEGRSLGDDHQKVGQYLEWWLDKALPGTVRDTTVVSYRGALRSNVIPHIGHVLGLDERELLPNPLGVPPVGEPDHMRDGEPVATDARCRASCPGRR